MPNKTLHLRFLAILLALSLLLLATPAYAAEQDGESMASSLRELGLFIGTDKGFELDIPCNRLMGAVILTRLLGQEQAALNGGFSHPFADVAGTYADPYIGYLYQQGLSNGVAADRYGNEPMSSQQFATLILRALGYQDTTDFYWYSALYTLAELGMLSSAEAEWLAANSFTRAEAVLLCHRALTSRPKGAEYTMIYGLLWNEVFNTRQLARSKDGSLLIAADMPDYMGYKVTVYTDQEFTGIVSLALLNRQSNLELFAPNLAQEQAQALLDALLAPYFARDFIVEMNYNGEGGYYISSYISEYMSMQFYYQNPQRYSKNYQFYDPDYQRASTDYVSMYLWQEKIDSIVRAQTTPEMSEFERVKALHDYIVLHTEYDDEAGEYSHSHFADGVLFGGQGVCDGFASALKVLLNGAGIECLVVFGSAPEGNHAWNQVKIDGEWYNVDSTWANTMGGGDVYYGYFCMPDDIFLRDHAPEKPELTRPCQSDKYQSSDPQTEDKSKP